MEEPHVTPPALAELVEERRAQILALFLAELKREEVAPPGVSRPLLVDHIPRFLDDIVEELRRVANARSGQDAVDTSETARKHGGQRWSLGYAGKSNAPLPSGLAGIRVLVVDDDPDARELVGMVVEMCGMEARLAASAVEALEEVTTYHPHAVISDIGMPDKDGYFLIRSIRTHPDPARRDIPVIALTAFSRNEDRSRALVEGFNLHLRKPVEPGELVRAVMDLVGHPGDETRGRGTE